jgi:hypothetical protein
VFSGKLFIAQVQGDKGRVKKFCVFCGRIIVIQPKPTTSRHGCTNPSKEYTCHRQLLLMVTAGNGRRGRKVSPVAGFLIACCLNIN